MATSSIGDTRAWTGRPRQIYNCGTTPTHTVLPLARFPESVETSVL